VYVNKKGEIIDYRIYPGSKNRLDTTMKE